MKQRYYSNVFWHFTGSPKGVDWSRYRRPKDILLQGKPRPPEQALRILFGILDSEFLMATCTEHISQKIRTQEFCCVTDIPLLDLMLHSKYYGKVALGFNCSAIHQAFNPVLYLPRRNFPRKKHLMRDGRTYIVEDFDDVDACDFDHEQLSDGTFQLILHHPQLRFFATEIESSTIDGYFINNLKITRFSPSIGESFYQEREWRCMGNFGFEKNWVEAVIVPRRLKQRVQEFLNSKQYRHVTVLTWEFLRRA